MPHRDSFWEGSTGILTIAQFILQLFVGVLGLYLAYRSLKLAKKLDHMNGDPLADIPPGVFELPGSSDYDSPPFSADGFPPPSIWAQKGANSQFIENRRSVLENRQLVENRRRERRRKRRYRDSQVFGWCSLALMVLLLLTLLGVNIAIQKATT